MYLIELEFGNSGTILFCLDVITGRSRKEIIYSKEVKRKEGIRGDQIFKEVVWAFLPWSACKKKGAGFSIVFADVSAYLDPWCVGACPVVFWVICVVRLQMQFDGFVSQTVWWCQTWRLARLEDGEWRCC